MKWKIRSFSMHIVHCAARILSFSINMLRNETNTSERETGDNHTNRSIRIVYSPHTAQGYFRHRRSEEGDKYVGCVQFLAQ